MLALDDTSLRGNRREMLRIGSLFGGLALSHLCGIRIPQVFASPAGPSADKLVTGKSVIFLFQQGGASQFETFDPKMDAPAEIRTVTGAAQTSVPGVVFGDTLQQLARMAHKLTVVRSYQTGNAGHNIRPLVGPESLNANIGSLFARVAGATHPVTSMPTNAVLFPQSVCSDVTPGQGRGDLAATGTLGSAYAAFIPGGGGDLLKNLRLNLAPDRFQDRQALRAQLDQLGRRFDSEARFDTLDEIQRQAVEVLLSGRVAEALDLSREDPALVARYDTSRFAARDGWSKTGRGKRGYYTGHAKSLGKALLLARRLCEAGCGFVTVHASYEGVWDMHADGNNLDMRDGMEAVGRSFDHAVAAFIEDVEQRGLSDRILLVAGGEMGRTPRINRRGGRDHWARLAPLMFYGGGMAEGKVIGQSTRDGGEPATEPYTSEHLIATILHTLLDAGLVRLEPALSAISKLAEPGPIPGLF